MMALTVFLVHVSVAPVDMVQIKIVALFMLTLTRRLLNSPLAFDSAPILSGT